MVGLPYIAAGGLHLVRPDLVLRITPYTRTSMEILLGCGLFAFLSFFFFLFLSFSFDFDFSLLLLFWTVLLELKSICFILTI